MKCRILYVHWCFVLLPSGLCSKRSLLFLVLLFNQTCASSESDLTWGVDLN